MHVLSHSKQVREKPGAGKGKAVASNAEVVTCGASCYGLARCGALWEEVEGLGGKFLNIDQIY